MCVQKKKYSRVKTMDDEGDDDEKDMIADEIFTGDGDGDGEVEDGEAVDTLHTRDDEEEEDDEESGRKDIYSIHHGFEFLCYNSVEFY